jgi:hypothetical protein
VILNLSMFHDIPNSKYGQESKVKRIILVILQLV